MVEERRIAQRQEQRHDMPQVEISKFSLATIFIQVAQILEAGSSIMEENFRQLLVRT